MKRTQISSLTPQEAADELVMMELSKLLQKARKAQIKADEALFAVHQALDDMCIDIDAPSKAENADCLNEAVSCYVQYGEYGCKNLLSEIRVLYTQRDEQ